EPWTYRERLRLEGGVLAGCGLAASVAIAVLTTGESRHVMSTVLQLAAVAVLLVVLGPLSVRRAVASARVVDQSEAGKGEPTPLWQLPLIVAVLTVPLGLLESWDTGLRASAGCFLVGLAQAVLLERSVAARERRAGGSYVRLPGSRILRGTRLGLMR
ncbi:MAG: hypothetical protein ACR2K9_02275, partial [Solirubrobacteraceae bacterium]